MSPYVEIPQHTSSNSFLTVQSNKELPQYPYRARLASLCQNTCRPGRRSCPDRSSSTLRASSTSGQLAGIGRILPSNLARNLEPSTLTRWRSLVASLCHVSHVRARRALRPDNGRHVLATTHSATSSRPNHSPERRDPPRPPLLPNPWLPPLCPIASVHVLISSRAPRPPCTASPP
jgi:hypothetical protein